MKNTLLVLLSITFSPLIIFGQPLPCGTPASMTSFCDDACVVCDIDGFTGINDSNVSGSLPPDFCTTTVHNAQWIAFRAASTNLTLSVDVFNCQNGGGGGGQNNGLEVAIYESIDCQNFTMVSNCDGEILPNTSQNFTNTVPLVIGQYYFFAMDGNGGDICQYTINVVDGSTEVPPLSATGAITGLDHACPGSMLTYTTPYIPAATIYEWTVNGAVVGTDTALTYTWPAEGTYQLCVQAQNVCDEATPTCLFVDIETLEPTVYVKHLCGGDSLVVADTVLYEAGYYEFHYDTPADCDSVIQVTLSAAPNQTTNLDVDICDGDTLWVGGNPYFDTGNYTENLSTWLDCDSTVNLDLFIIICEIQADVAVSQVQCFGGSDGIITFSVVDGTPPFTYDWYRLGQPGPSGTGNISGLNTPEILQGLPVGTYVITVVDAFGNDRVVITDMTQPTQLEVNANASTYGGGYNVSCFGSMDGSLLAFANGGLPPYSFAWTTGDNTALAPDLAAGDYTVTVTDQALCTLTATYTLESPDPLQLAAVFNDPICDGPLTGSILAQSVAGGVPAYHYSLNESPYGDSTSFENLPEGSYTLSVQDANGCQLDSTVELVAAVIPVLELADTSLYLGDSLLLRPELVLGAELYAWGQNPGLSCYDCPTPWVYIFHSNSYGLTVTSEDGCTTSDSLFVEVIPRRRVYVPNAFSPNNDGINDLFTVFGGAEVRRVKSFNVFSRWGEHVFELEDFMPNTPGLGWDGSFKGKNMQGAVFAWTAEIEFLDDEVVLFKGDVVIVK